jgi:L-rhamnose-H+ transport protein
MDVRSASLFIGLLWVFLAGVGQGAFPLPMKYTKVWKWEHLWFWYSMIAFFLLPVVLALATVPKLPEVFSSAPLSSQVFAALCGMCWGAGSVFFGLGIDALGMALGFSMMTGLYTALGALIPLLILTPDIAFKRNGLLIILGNIVTVIGVALCAIAGERRDKILGSQSQPVTLGPKRSFTAGLVICILSGILSPGLNFGYAFGSKITEAAQRLGASANNATNAIWLLLIPAGGLLNIGYCAYLMNRNCSWKTLIRDSKPAEWAGAWSMGLVWTGSVVVYGWGANDLGRLGPSLGWSLWNTILIATTVVLGLATHEWRGVRGKPLRLLFIGIGVLIFGMFVLGAGT